MGFRWKLILALSALFVIGGFCGSAVTLAILKAKFLGKGLRNGKPWEEVLMRNLTTNLKLSDEQRDQIRPQIDTAFQQMRALHRQVTVQADDILDQTLQRIRSQLNPDQQERLERFRARRQERIRRFLEKFKP